jgi:hypothetical protein
MSWTLDVWRDRAWDFWYGAFGGLAGRLPVLGDRCRPRRGTGRLCPNRSAVLCRYFRVNFCTARGWERSCALRQVRPDVRRICRMAAHQSPSGRRKFDPFARRNRPLRSASSKRYCELRVTRFRLGGDVTPVLGAGKLLVLKGVHCMPHRPARCKEQRIV